MALALVLVTFSTGGVGEPPVLAHVVEGVTKATMPAAAPQERILRGRVVDSAAAPVPSARVSVVETGRVTHTDAVGVFRIEIPAGRWTLLVQRIGYRPQRVQVGDAADATLDVVLARAPEQLAGVLVPGGETVPRGLVSTRQTIGRAPALGEPDAMRALRYLPGITQPNDFVGRVHLAGAAVDETLTMLDGHPMQGATHLSGLFSGISPGGVDRVEVLVHHVPATTDARVGGTIAMHTRELDARRSREASISPLAVSGAWAGAGLPGGTDLVLSGRTTSLYRFLSDVSVGPQAGDKLLPDFRDLLARVGLAHRAWRLEALSFVSQDLKAPRGSNSLEPIRSEVLAGLTAARRDRRGWTTLRASWDAARRREDELDIPERRTLRFDQALVALSAQRGWWLARGASLSARVSVNDRDHRYDWRSERSISSAGAPTRLSYRDRQVLTTAAAEYVRPVSARILLTTGAVVSGAEGSLRLAPRMLATWRLSPSAELSLALERRHQFDGELGPPRSADRTAPVFLLDRPRRTDAMTLGAAGQWRAARGDFVSLRADIFVRRTADRPVGLATPAVTDTVIADRPALAYVRADAVGLAIGATAALASGTALQVAFTGSRARTRATEAWVRSPWDRPIALVMTATQPLGGRWSAHAAWRVQSGLPVTPLVGFVPSPSPDSPGLPVLGRPVLGVPYSARLDASQRVDVSIRREWALRRLRGDLRLELWNALGDDSPQEVDWRPSAGALQLTTVTYALPRIPSIGVSIRW